MHATDFGRTLIIANPAAQSGAAHEVAERLQRFLDMTARTSQFDLVLTERLGRSRFTGGLDLDYGLRFDAQAGAIRMADARVNRLSVDQLPRAQQQLVAQYAPRIAEQLLADLVIYRFPPEQLELAHNLGLVVGALQVTREGLSVEMLPQGLR